MGVLCQVKVRKQATRVWGPQRTAAKYVAQLHRPVWRYHCGNPVMTACRACNDHLDTAAYCKQQSLDSLKTAARIKLSCPQSQKHPPNNHSLEMRQLEIIIVSSKAKKWDDRSRYLDLMRRSCVHSSQGHTPTSAQQKLTCLRIALQLSSGIWARGR